MKNTLRNILFGKGNYSNGLIALTIISLIALGCTCDADGFKFGDKKSDSNTSEKKNKEKGNPFEDGDKDDKDEDFEKADASKGDIPSEKELNSMVKADVLAFDKALKDEDFSDFHDRISKLWKKQTTPRKLKKGFQSFIDGKADLSGVKDLDAKFTSDPKIDKSKRVKILEVEGEFDTSPRTSTFELKYVPDGKEWKLFGFYVKTTVYKKR